MPVVNISLKSMVRAILNKMGSVTGDKVEVTAAEKWAVPFLRLAPSVTSADYASLKAQILAITGIDGVELMVDSETLIAELAALGWTPEPGEVLNVYVSAHPRVEASP